jgi:hypothetical protein
MLDTRAGVFILLGRGAVDGASAGVDAEARRMRLDKVMVSNVGR